MLSITLIPFLQQKTYMAKAKRKKRAIEFPCSSNPTWSVSRYQTFIRSAMRRAWLKWPPRFEALIRARRPFVTDNPKCKQKWEFQCAHCQKWVMGKDVSVDHIVPWGYIWDLPILEAWSRLLVGIEGLQVLCSACHDRKTKSEQ